MALEQITFNIGAFNDSDAGGNNYFTNTVFEVKNQSDNTFATIYADASGTTQIPQNGIDNISNSRGECNFYIDDGDFYLEVNSQQKNFNIGNFKTDFTNIDEVKAYPKLSKLIGQRITTGEYHAGTGYGGATYEVVSAGSVTPNDIDIIQGVADSGAAVKLVYKSNQISLSKFGFVSNDGIDYSNTINYLFNKFTNDGGCTVVILGNCLASGVIIQDYCFIDGVNVNASRITAPSGWSSGNVVETRDFDIYVRDDGSTGNEPTTCGLKNITIDGNAENYIGTTSSTEGMCARLAAVRLHMENVRFDNAPGIGIHTGLRAVKRVNTLWFKDDTKLGKISNVKVFGARNDGWIFEGPTDSFLEGVEIGVCGWPDTTYTASRPSLYDPSRRVQNIVISGAVEIGWLHSFGCREGGAFLIDNGPNTTGTIRVKWDNMILESSNGGFKAASSARYQGSILDSHNNYGIDGAEYVRCDSDLACCIDNVEIVCSNNENGQDKISLKGQNTTILNAGISGVGTSGKGVNIGGYNNKVSALIKNIGDAGVNIESGASRYSVTAYCDACDTVANNEDSTSVPNRVDITSGFGNTNTFVGFDLYDTRARSDIKLTEAGGSRRTTEWSGTSADIDNSVVGLQTITVPISAVYAPNPDEIGFSVNYESGRMRNINRVFALPSGTNENRVQFQIEFEDDGGTSGTSTISAYKV